MRDFFKTTRFKVILCVLALLLGFMIQAAYSGTLSSVASKAIGFVSTPFQAISSAVTGWFGGFFDRLTLADELLEENAQLQQQVRQLQGQLADLDRYKSENETYREMLQIQEEHPTFEMEAASVIARDSSSRFYSFKIDRGSDQGIALQDPVITQAGMVGIISEVGPNYAVVTTLLDPAFKVGATATASRDPGMVEGDVTLAQEGKTKLRYLAPTSEVKAGELVMSSDLGGTYPADLLIGTVLEVQMESSGISKYAVVQPAVNASEVTSVMVVKAY